MGIEYLKIQDALKAQNERYRKALEEIMEVWESGSDTMDKDMMRIARQALKEANQ